MGQKRCKMSQTICLSCKTVIDCHCEQGDHIALDKRQSTIKWTKISGAGSLPEKDGRYLVTALVVSKQGVVLDFDRFLNSRFEKYPVSVVYWADIHKYPRDF